MLSDTETAVHAKAEAGPFNMSEVRDNLLTSYQAGRFLEAVYEFSLTDADERNELASAVVELHNDKLIDAVSAFELLKEKSKTGPDFFIARHVFEKALPELDAPTSSVMRCVLQLYRDAGHDGAAGSIISSFVEFCTKKPTRPQESLDQIEKHPRDFADLLAATVSAGSRLDSNLYLAQVIRLCESQDTYLKRAAVFSMSRIHWPDAATTPLDAFRCLEEVATAETDDHMLANVITSAFSLLQRFKSEEDRVIEIIRVSLSKANDFALHAASEVLGFHTKELPDTFIDELLKHCSRVKADNKGTVDNLDYGLACILKSQNPMKALLFLEYYLIANASSLNKKSFDSVIRDIRQSPALLNKITTRWFLRGNSQLCEFVQLIVSSNRDRDLQLDIDPGELTPADPVRTIFVARKCLGYLFFHPSCAASFLLSLIRHTSDKATLAELSDLLFDPLLLNFPGDTRTCIVQQSESLTGEAKLAVERAVKTIDEYFDVSQAVGSLPALHPSVSQREAHHRHFSRMMEESYKAAEAESVFLSLISKSVLLYGRSSIDYVYSDNGKSNRMETELKSHGAEIEFPRMGHIDPFGLDYMLRVFRGERIQA